MRKSCYFLMLLAIATFFVTCKPEPEPEPEPEPTYNLTFWTNEDLDGVIVVNLYDNGGYDKEGYISKVYSYTPDCGDNGCATFKDLDPGRYYYYATCGYYEWEGEVNVTETCELVKLNESNAIEKYNVTFWTNDSDCNNITVNLYNSGYDEYRVITKVLSSTPDCGENGCASFEDINPGKYYYYAINDDFEWEGEINVNDACELVKLNESNAIEKYNVTFWTNDSDCNDIIVNLYNSGYDEYRDITKVLSSTPDCKENGCANFEDIEPGYYYYYASNGNFEWEGEVNVTEACELVKLNESNAIEKARVSFWTDEEDILQVVEVNLWKTGNPNAYDETETITMYYNPGNSPDNCGEEGCANFYDVEYGEYSFYAENDYYSWSGTLTVDYPCELMKLILGKAEVKTNVQPSGREQIKSIK